MDKGAPQWIEDLEFRLPVRLKEVNSLPKLPESEWKF